MATVLRLPALRPLLALLLLVASLAAAPAAGADAGRADDASASTKQAFDLLMDRYVHPPASAALLGSAWDAARHASADPGRPAPAFSGDRDADWRAFAQGVEALEQSTGADKVTVGAAAIRAMAESVHESHTYYLSHDRYQDYLSWLHGDVHYSGIGARMEGTSLTVVEVFAGSPAEQAGLRPGDSIEAVDGRSIDGLAQDQVIRMIRGPSGSPVTLTVRRDGRDQPLDLSMTRAMVQIAFVRSQMLADGVGYVRLRGFADTSVADSFEAALDDLQHQGATSLVLDLRGNSGGRLDVGQRLLSRFVQSGPLYHELDRDGASRAIQAQAGRANGPALPLAVLVDGGTASMGEIFAAAIQDYHRGSVIGTRTAGSVAAAQVFGLQDGSGLQVTVMEITSADGRVLNGKGVEPDRTIAPDLAALRQGHDNQVEAAVAALHQPPTNVQTVPPVSRRLERLAA